MSVLIFHGVLIGLCLFALGYNIHVLREVKSRSLKWLVVVNILYMAGLTFVCVWDLYHTWKKLGY